MPINLALNFSAAQIIDLRLIISCFALLISLYVLYRTIKHDGIIRENNINKILTDSWVLMGGDYSSMTIRNFNDRSSLNRANDQINACMKMNKKYWRVHHLKGIYYLGKDTSTDRKMSIQYFENALKFNKNSESLLYLGILYKIDKDYDQAKQYYLEAMKIGSKNTLTHNNLGELYEVLGNDDEAKKQYMEALEIDQKYTITHLNLGVFFQKIGRFDESEKHYRKAISIDENCAETYHEYGNLLSQRGRDEAAQIQYRKAYDNKLKCHHFYNHYGYLLEKLGKLTDAKRYYEEALTLAPEYTSASDNLKRLMTNL